MIAEERKKSPSRKFLSRHSWKKSVTTIEIVVTTKERWNYRDQHREKAINTGREKREKEIEEREQSQREKE